MTCMKIIVIIIVIMFIIMIISLTLFSFVRRKIFRSKFFLSIAVSSNAFYLASVQIDKMKVA